MRCLPVFDTLCLPVLISIMLLVGTGLSHAAETDDSSLYIDAFTAFQSQNYPRAIDRIETLRLTFPESPLNDIALLLLARSALRNGDSERAARAVCRFTTEYPSSPLKSGIGSELKDLGDQWCAGQRFIVARQTPASGLLDRIPPLVSGTSSGQSKHAAESSQAAPTPPPRTAASPSPINQVRIVSLSGDRQTVASGQKGSIPFEVVNYGDKEARVLLDPVIPADMEPLLTIAGNNAGLPARLVLGPGAGSRGALGFLMPHSRVDGQRTAISLQVISLPDHTVLQSMDIRVTTEAPLLRAIARTVRPKPARGEQTGFNITLLNAGSLPAQNLTVRVIMPPQLEFIDIKGVSFNREDGTGIPVVMLDSLHPGRLEEFSVSAKIRDNSQPGLELRTRLEVQHGLTPVRETFYSGPVSVQRK